MRTVLSLLSFSAVLCVASSEARAQGWDLTPLVLEGDAVAGVGNVTSIFDLAVNDQLDWLVEVDTDNPDTDSDSAVVDAGGPLFVENQPLAMPAGSFLDSFDSVGLNGKGQLAWNLFLDGTAGSFDDSGVYLGTQLLVQESGILSAPGISPGTLWRGFFDVRIDASDHVFVLGTVDDPAIPSTVDQVMVELTLDPSGAVVAETVLYKEGDVLPGTGGSVTTFETSPHEVAYNASGSLMFAADTDLPAGTDGFVFVDSTEIAQEGDPSPVAGRNWSSLSSPELDLNDAGEWVFSGSLDGDTASNLLIVLNGAKFRQEGDPVPGLTTFSLTSFGSGPISLANTGDVAWFGDWDDPNTDVDTGLFVNDELVVQEGVTTIGGLVVDSLFGVQDGFELSRDGRFLVFEATLEDGSNGAFLATRAGSVTPIAACIPNAGVLAQAGGSRSIGDAIDFSLDNAQGMPAATTLFFSPTQLIVMPPCGLFLPGIGEVLIGIVPPGPFPIPGPAWMGAPVVVTLPIPNDVTLVEATLHFQGLFVDPASPTEPFRLTDGLAVTFGL